MASISPTIKDRARKVALPASVIMAIAMAGPFAVKHEGEKYHAYPDIGNVWTICNGATRWENGQPVKQGDVATPAVCGELTQTQMADYGAQTWRVLGFPEDLAPRTMMSFIDFAYNVGAGTLANSSMAKHVKKGDLLSACNDLVAYRFAAHHDCALDKGKPHGCYGVYTRRLDEREACLSGIKR